MYIKTPFVLISFLFAVSTTAFAEAPVIFDDIDTDADGCISKSEANVRKDLVENFSNIDKDRDGSICVDEYTKYENRGEFVPDDVEIPEVGAAPVE